MTKFRETRFAGRIKELRSRLGLMQEHFLAKAWVAFSTIGRLESYKSKPFCLSMRQIEELMEP